jgi:hypothetical protein
MIALGGVNFKGLVTTIVCCGAQLPHLTGSGGTEIPRLGLIEDPPWSMNCLKALRIIRCCLLARS